TGEIAVAVNELLENAIKFCDRGPIEIAIGARAGEVYCSVTHPVVAEVAALRDQLAALVAADPLEALVSRVEDNAARADSDAGIGLLTLRSDYGAELGFRLWPDAARAGVVVVETTVRIPGGET